MKETGEVTILSLGGGFQSTALVLMLNTGQLPGCPAPDAAVLADTQAEPPWVYETLDILSNHLDYPILRSTKGALEADTQAAIHSGVDKFLDIPMYRYGRLPERQCTTHYKVMTLRRAIPAHFGWPQRVRQYIGISLDEAVRMRNSDVAYIPHDYPLVDQRISRSDCQAWMTAHYPHIPIGKSSRYFCPFHSEAAWAELPQKAPELMARAPVMDDALAASGNAPARNGRRAMRERLAAQTTLPMADPRPAMSARASVSCKPPTPQNQQNRCPAFS